MALFVSSEDQKLIDDIAPRLLNWRRCYGDSSSPQQSITGIFCDYLKRFYDQKEPDPPRPSDLNRLPPLDYKDADLLLDVWRSLPPDDIQGVPVKLLVTLFVFYKPYQFILIRDRYYKTNKGMWDLMKQAVLIFAKRVNACS